MVLLLSRKLPPGAPGEAMWTLWWPLAWTMGKTFSSWTHYQPCSTRRAPQIRFNGPGAVQQGKVLVGRRVVWSVCQERNTRSGSQ